ncbi:MAG: RecB family exonuclease, partial [Acidimicrobiales bacterium]
ARDDVGAPLVPAADPDRWWGLAETTHSDTPVVAEGEPVLLSASGLQRMQECPLRWFLEKKAAAEQASSAAMGFGNVVHALAHEVGQGATSADLDALMRRLDTVWHQLSFDAPWQSVQQREHARESLVRLLAWHVADRGRELVGTEVGFDVLLPVEGAEVRLRGQVDRLERTADGALHVVDLKTGKTPPLPKDLPAHPQLGTYQLVVREGGLGPGHPGGAELVQLRSDGPGGPLVQPQGALADDWVDTLLATAVRRIVTETFPPHVEDNRCARCAFARACPGRSEGRQVVS